MANLSGNAWVYKDNVDTDVIIPARYLNTSDPKELAKYCMEDIDKDFATNVQEGDIMIAGENFGCGSSREHAPIAIKASGISVVIAKTFARIFTQRINENLRRRYNYNKRIFKTSNSYEKTLRKRTIRRT